MTNRTSALPRVLAATLLALSLATPPALAETEAQKKVVQALDAWGLLGTWSLDCSQPPNRSNGYLAYVVQDGVALHTRDFGDAQDENEILDANLQPDGGLEVVVHFQSFNQTRKYVMIKKDGRVRSLSNSLADNTGYTIREGKFVSNGNETPWQTQCPMEAPAGVPDAEADPMQPK